jgi:probable RNA-binding protein EIF1AD
MSGSGRKSQYRKSVTTDFLNDDRVPEENEKVVLVIGNRGDNTFEIELETGEKGLARLPKKFNKLIWIKSGDFLIIDNEDSDASLVAVGEAKAQYTIKHILSKQNVKYLKTLKLWPAHYDSLNDIISMPDTGTTNGSSASSLQQGYDSGYGMPRAMEGDEYEEEEEEEEEMELDKMGNYIVKSK